MDMKDVAVTALVATVILLFQAGHVQSSAEVMKDIAKGLGPAMQQCAKELKLSDDSLNEMYNFWNDKYELKSRDVGCAIICMVKKHGIVDEDGKLHHENGHEFAKKFGADDETAKKLVDIVHTCHEASDHIEEECARVLEAAKCFRVESKKLNWMPNFQELVDEIMS